MPEGGSRGRGMRRRTIVAVALLAILVLFVGGLVIYSARALSRFERVEARRSTLLYAAPPILLQSSYARPEGEAGAPAGSLKSAGPRVPLNTRERF